MPTYDYTCESCNYSFEEFQSMFAGKLRKCPECGRLTLKRLIGAGAAIIIRGTKTSCSGSRKNSERKEKRRDKKQKLKKQQIVAAEKAKKNPPWWRTRQDSKINMNVLKDPKKYVNTGEID